ncbi:MAG: YDG domain-containing protein [Bacteroidota bacterium]
MKTNYNQNDVGSRTRWLHPFFKPLLTLFMVFLLGMSVMAQPFTMLGSSICWNGTNSTTLGLSGGYVGEYHVLLHFKPNGTITKTTLVLPSTTDPFNFVVNYGTAAGTQGLYVVYVYTELQYMALLSSNYALDKVMAGMRQTGEVWIYSSPLIQTLSYYGTQGTNYTLSGDTALYCNGNAVVTLSNSEISNYGIYVDLGIIPFDEWKISYQLLKNDVAYGSAFSGTGYAMNLSLPTGETNTYTVRAIRLGGCSPRIMTGAPIVSDMATVKNTNSGLCYFTIQKAIDDPVTLNSHTIYCTIQKDYNENLTINKGITLMPDPALSGSNFVNIMGYIDIKANNVTIKNFDGVISFGAIKTPAINYAIKVFPGFGNFLLDNLLLINSIQDGILVETNAGGGTISNCFLSLNTIGINVAGNLTGLLSITDNEIEGTSPTSSDFGILNHAGNTVISGNTFNDVLTAISNTGDAVSITGCQFGNINDFGVGVLNTGANVAVYDNDFQFIATTAINSTVALDAVSNWFGSTTGPTISTNPCGTGSTIIGVDVVYNPWYFSTTTYNGLPTVSLNPIPNMSTITKTPLIISVTAGYPSGLSDYDPAVLTDAKFISDSVFPVGAKIISVKINGIEVLGSEYGLSGKTEVYLSEVLGSTSSLADHDGLTGVWDFTLAGFDATWTSKLTLDIVSYINSKSECNNLLATETFNLAFANASMSIIDKVTPVCTTFEPLKFKVSIGYPTIANMNTEIKSDVRFTSIPLIPEGTEIKWGYNAPPTNSFFVPVGGTHLLMLSEIMGSGPDPLQGNGGTDVWEFEITAPVGTYDYLTIEPVAVLGVQKYAYAHDTIKLIVHPLPTATLTVEGQTHICTGGSANLKVALTGKSPWNITYSDGTTPVTVTGIIPNHYEFSPVQTAKTTWSITNVTDANGCSNTPSGSVTVYIGTITTVAAPAAAPCVGSDFIIPIKVDNFDDVGVLSLTLHFNESVLTYQSFTTAFPGIFSVIYNPLSPGVLKLGGYNPAQGYALPNGSDLFNLTFTYKGGVAPLTWDVITPDACEYISYETGLAFCRIPAATYYIDRSVTGNPRPTAVLSGPAAVCEGSTTNLTLTFTGTAPWTYSINSGAPVTTSSNPESHSVTVVGATTYSITGLNDFHCTSISSDYAGSVTIATNPLPAAPTGSDVTATYTKLEHTASATAPTGSHIVWYTTEFGSATTVAPARTIVGSNSAWAESVNDITLCKSGTRTLVTVTVTKKAITGNFTAANKVYDRGTLATVVTRTLNDVISGDVVLLTGGVANFDTKDVGLLKIVTLTGATLSGADAGNYDLTSVATTIADITQLGLTGHVTVDATRVYDAGTLSNVLTRTLTGVISPDDVTLTGGIANYNNKTVGAVKTVTLTGMTLAGADIANYSLNVTPITTTAAITALGITGSFTIPATREYNGTTVATILTSPLIGVLSGDIVTLSCAANYDTRNIGTGKTVTFTLPVLAGADAVNYTVTIPVTTTTANITIKGINVTAVADSRVYNDGVSSAGIPLKGTLQPGDFTVTNPTQVYSSKNVGTGKTIRASGWVINDGNGGSNYSVTYTNNLSGVITKLGITGNITVDATKVYDGGTTSNILTRTLNGVLGTNVVMLTGGNATYSDKNVGTGKIVTFNTATATLTGADAGNYSLTTVATTTANITKKTVTPAVVADSKCYDGNTTATLSSKTLTGVLGSDVVTLVVGAANFDNANPGTGKTVTATSLSLTGTDAGNYLLSTTTTTTTATIYPTPVASAAVTTPITCYGGTGTVTLTATVGTAPFSYTFNGTTNSTGVFTNILAGVNYAWSVTAHTCGPVTGTLTVTQPEAIPLSGKVTYYNTANTPLNDVTIALKQSGVTIHTVVTSGAGDYSFANVCPGTYDVVASSSSPVGGINVTDAALVNSWFTRPVAIEKVKFYAGDVVLNNQLLPNDAGRIQSYFMTSGIPPWSVRPSWTFWLTGETIAVNPASSPDLKFPTVTIVPLSGPVTGINLYALVTGDFNRSFVPGPIVKSASKSLSLKYKETSIVNRNQEVELPVYAGSAMEVGAISLIMNFPSDKVEITGVALSADNSPMSYSVYGDELRIGWTSTNPLSVKAGEKMLILKLRITGALAKDETISFSLAADPLNELADGLSNVINDAVLYIDKFGASSLSVNDPISTESLNLANHPNPFMETTTFDYNLPSNGEVSLEIRDMLGSKVIALLDNKVQTAGSHSLIMNSNTLKPGVYMATLTLKSDGQTQMRTIKVVRNQ